MHRLPQKISLVTQTATLLREEIAAGRWTHWLPGEHELRKQLHVSRTTLRGALSQLHRQGIIRCQQGRRREILLRKAPAKKVQSQRVVLLMPELTQGRLFRAFLIDRLREHLAEEGYFLETHVSRVPYRARSPRDMEQLAAMLRPAGWVLMGATEPLQKWFVEHRLPCVIAGTPYGDIQLPSVDVDYNAVCRHAVGQFVAHGHRQIVLLNPHPGGAGEAVTEAGFREVVAQFKARGVEASVVRHDGTLENICARLDALRARRPAPTAFLVSRARHALTVLCHLSQNGLRVPKDVAIISRDDELFLEDVVPTMARYSNLPGAFAAKLSRTVVAMLRGDGRPYAHKIMPKFIPGRTLD